MDRLLEEGQKIIELPLEKKKCCYSILFYSIKSVINWILLFFRTKIKSKLEASFLLWAVFTVVVWKRRNELEIPKALFSNKLLFYRFKREDFEGGGLINSSIENRIMLLGYLLLRSMRWHGVWNSQKKSHSSLRAKRATFTFWVNKSLFKMPKMVHFG